MNLTLTGGTDQQRQWFQDAVASLKFPVALIGADVEVQWVGEPPCPGHSEYACTQVTGTDATIFVRDTLDTVQGKLVYTDVVWHEIGHVRHFTGYTLAQRQAQTADWTYRAGTGELIVGSAADLNPSDKDWADRIQEAWAEVFKDTFGPANLRAFDNRTNWRITEDKWSGMFGGSAGKRVDTWTGTLHGWGDAT